MKIFQITTIATLASVLITSAGCAKNDVTAETKKTQITAATKKPAAVAKTEVAKSQTLRVYHIGNSVTDTIRYGQLEQMVSSGDDKYIWGRTMIPGSPLAWLWTHPNDGFAQEPFGRWPEALPKHTWDVVTLQPFDRKLNGDDGDLAMAKNFINLALKNPDNASTQFYIYSRWPRRDEKGDGEKKTYSLDYAAKWNRKYTGGWDGTEETKDYFEKLVLALRDEYPKLKKPILMVPVGDVLLEIETRAKAGKIPGLQSVGEFYHDGIHFNNVGAFAVATTFYATMFKETPVDLKADAFAPGKETYDREISPELAKAIQQTVWDVVSTHPLAGVKD